MGVVPTSPKSGACPRLCGRGWEKSKEVLCVAFLCLFCLEVCILGRIVGVFERAAGRELSTAEGGDGARATSRRSGSARHRSGEHLGGRARTGGRGWYHCGRRGSGRKGGAEDPPRQGDLRRPDGPDTPLMVSYHWSLSGTLFAPSAAYSYTNSMTSLVATSIMIE